MNNTLFFIYFFLRVANDAKIQLLADKISRNDTLFAESPLLKAFYELFFQI